ncbi:NACHT, LRR and PYD domains-containing protein 12 isoform X1 [Labeo rohita]|uniref:NACHT, LRR and PYD domains-containing protein 12 isoform X1 n=1 Tax=Labeo rohita TaxID=84645 RepID=UPI0021E1E59B|nr:NACHT, LRR and PYD domains-containing protein 12 isoform X1 [Labeo rohita]XP_050963603.1 NACHT, LRR and PYD domains-containing protein 12 isoform X1 [Labeo rohita]XP_050963604.1 NACHT, LRR and PYD domains-containing protein 12 isoform X1 [Labeo rohita]XP_050963605.1 NACHT, LRR and PYD domains-containing protein 12 isoform X1 [Labeo rohita]
METQMEAPGKVSLSEEGEKSVVVHYQNQRAASPEPSCVSMKSDGSMRHPPDLSDETFNTRQKRSQTESCSASSCVSMKSDGSMRHPPDLSDEAMTTDPVNKILKTQKNTTSKTSPSEVREDGDFVHYQNQRAASLEPSCVSLKSDVSMRHPPDLSDRTVTSDCVVDRDDQTKILTQVLHHLVDDELQTVIEKHKSSMKKKCESLFEPVKLQDNQTLLNKIYTQLYIIEGESEWVNEEHKVLHVEKSPRTQHSQDTLIYCNDIFKPLTEPGFDKKDKLKVVLTKGIAGIGKSVSVQKFILDWAEGKANQDIDFMFVLPFRELNLIQDDQYSLHKLLLDFHPKLQELNPRIFEESEVVFIFDGLDESRITLMFSDNEKVSDVTQTSTVGVLISNLLKGELLPSAFIWITSRPAAAEQIPSKYINRVTEIQGFDEPQKEEYFRKRISDEDQVSRVISHIRKARSLHIMCHIPVFCCISATVLEKILKQGTEIPQTLTEMYIHFLLIQTSMKNQKYEEGDTQKLMQSNREVIVKLGELAFKQLMKGNVMFYEEDLRDCCIDITAAVYSGICTEIFKQESVIQHRKVYCFIHLSFQEFLAAFYVFFSHLMKNMEPLQLFLHEECEHSENKQERSRRNALCELLTSAATKTLKNKNGHLDLFLRFLLGISLESNQRLLQDLLTYTENSSETIKETAQYIKDRINCYNLSADRSISLFLCLLEVNDQTLCTEIQEFVKSDQHSEKRLSPVHCSAIAYMFQMSEEVLDKFEPTKYNTSYEGRWRLIPAVMNCKKALLAGCCLSNQHCETVCSALQSSNSYLRELDMSNNDLLDLGVRLLCAGLKNSHCHLNILRLAGCRLTDSHCEHLSSAIQSPNSRLCELDLSNNVLQNSGVKLLCAGLENSYCQLNILRLAGCCLSDHHCESLSSALQSSNSCLRELDLSNNDIHDSGVKLLSAGLKNAHCQLNILRLAGCRLTSQCCESLSSVLQSSDSHLRELDLSNNDLQDSGVMLLAAGLESSQSPVKTLRLVICNLTDLCCESLSSALQSPNSCLRELDLSNNDLQDSGVKLLCTGLKSTQCQLNILRLSGCKMTEESCRYVCSALTSNPSHLRELDLSYNHPGESGVKLLTDTLNNALDNLNVDHGGELRIAAGLQKYAWDLTLDPNTANSHLILSEENRKVTYVEESQSYPDHAERFDGWPQVLCRESLSGRCYWEAEWSGYAVTSVAYIGICRKGWNEFSEFGYNRNNRNSWSLICSDSFIACHDNKETVIHVPPCSSKRIGVYVDWSAGTLSFYSVSNTLTHLHTFTSTFTEPLYAGFGVYRSNSSVALCDIKKPYTHLTEVNVKACLSSHKS